MILESTLLEIHPNDVELTRLAQTLDIQSVFGLVRGRTAQFMVFESRLREGRKDKIVYCCLSGGELKDPQLGMTEDNFGLTAVGRAALAMLLLVPRPTEQERPLFFKELRLGPTPLRTKVEQTLHSVPPYSKICFFGDMAGELDGKMTEALGWNQRIKSAT